MDSIHLTEILYTREIYFKSNICQPFGIIMNHLSVITFTFNLIFCDLTCYSYRPRLIKFYYISDRFCAYQIFFLPTNWLMNYLIGLINIPPFVKVLHHRMTKFYANFNKSSTSSIFLTFYQRSRFRFFNVSREQKSLLNWVCFIQFWF